MGEAGETIKQDSSFDASGQLSSGHNDKRPKVHTSFRINPVVELFNKMKGDKEIMLKQIGLHGLTNLPREEPTCNRSFNWQFAFNLLKDFDSETGSLELGERGHIELKDGDVELVFGIPSSGNELKKSDPLKMTNTKRLVKEALLLDSNKELNLENVMVVLQRDIPEETDGAHRRAFIMASFILAVSYFLAPKGRPPRVNNDILECILDTGNVHNINWASYILQSLKEASGKLKRELEANTNSVTLDGCLLLLQIEYLDNLDLGSLSTKHDVIPRVKDYTFERLDKMINADKIRVGSSKVQQFGVNQLRGDEDSLYSRGDLCRSIRMSKERMAAGVFLQSDKRIVLEYVRRSIDEGKRRVRIASRQFEEKAINAMDQCHNEISTFLDNYLTDKEQEGPVHSDGAKRNNWMIKSTTKRPSKVRRLETTNHEGGQD